MFGLAYFPRMHFRKYPKDDIVFCDNNEVLVVITGSIVMNSHVERVVPSKFYARYEEGDIIGSFYDSGELKRQENW